jgi:hypothetical protein
VIHASVEAQTSGNPVLGKVRKKERRKKGGKEDFEQDLEKI